MSSSSSSSSSDSEITSGALFIGKVMQHTIEMLAENEAESSRRPHSGLRSAPLRRNREEGHRRLIEDYFADDAVYAVKFRRRFRMRKELFLRIINDLRARFPYFQQREDARGRVGFSTEQKCTAAVRQLAVGAGADTWDEYFRMSERTVRESLYKFCKAIIILYRARYLRKPTINDTHQLYTVHESRHGFPGMLGSIDCMHWPWLMCPTAWRGQFMRGDHKEPTIILEAVASQDLWIWHAFFGVAGSNNDINVLDQSPVFNDIYQGKAYDIPFVVNGVSYKRGYYLTDGIYPELAVFVKSFMAPDDEKRKKFKEAQEAARKDVERAFGVLKRRWNILYNPARSWDHRKIQKIMYACIILHNMILEDEGKAICRYDENESLPPLEPLSIDSEQYFINRTEVRNRDTHHNLRADLVEHIFRTNVEHVEEPIDDLFESSDDESDLYLSDDLDGDSEDDDFDGDSDQSEE